MDVQEIIHARKRAVGDRCWCSRRLSVATLRTPPRCCSDLAPALEGDVAVVLVPAGACTQPGACPVVEPRSAHKLAFEAFGLAYLTARKLVPFRNGVPPPDL